jgi:AhpD family alkylhydroperoxidase
MTGNTRIPKTKITGIYGGLLKIMARKMLGHVPESVGVLWHYPTILRDMMGFGRKIEKWDRLDRNVASLAHLAAASLVGCGFCVDLQYFQARNQGLDTAKLLEVPRWRESHAFTPLERRVLQYAEAMSQTPPAVTDEMSAALLDELGASALLELTARVAFVNCSARMNVALGIRSEGFAAACGLPALATRSANDMASVS